MTCPRIRSVTWNESPGKLQAQCEAYFMHELARSALLRVYARIFGFAVLLAFPPRRPVLWSTAEVKLRGRFYGRYPQHPITKTRTPNPKTRTPNPKPKTTNPKPRTPNPESHANDKDHIPNYTLRISNPTPQTRKF